MENDDRRKHIVMVALGCLALLIVTLLFVGSGKHGVNPIGTLPATSPNVQ